MSYTNTILERLTKLHPKIIDLSLERVIDLLNKLENPHLNIPPAIHIAGTNGKGSTLSFLKAGLEASNSVVHTYTSPHLVTFNERIVLKGKKIAESLLVKYLEKCERTNRANNITFFEITTCAAFLAFSKHEADYTLLEVGLGGKLDATNVIQNPILSIITPISIDHQQFLGNSIMEIATEKAGILKPKVPAVIGKQSVEVQEKICSIADSLSVPTRLFGRDWFSKKYKNSMIYEDHDGILELPTPKLEGIHQFENAGIAITALKILKATDNALVKSVQNVKWPARLHQLKRGPLLDQLENHSGKVELWIDGGHNQDSAKAIASFLSQPFEGSSHIIFGMIKSKDIKSFIAELSSLTDSIDCISIPNEPASLTKEQIFKETNPFHAKTYMAENSSRALERIITQSKNKHNIRVLICGSLYLCGHILQNHS